MSLFQFYFTFPLVHLALIMQNELYERSKEINIYLALVTSCVFNEFKFIKIRGIKSWGRGCGQHEDHLVR